MPAFQSLVGSSLKRRSDQDEDLSRKRAAVGPTEIVDRQAAQGNGGEQYWMVQWRAPQARKHKTWDGDAVLAVSGTQGTLYDLEGKSIGSGKVELPIFEEKEFHFSGRDIGIDRAIARVEYLSGSCFGRTFFTSPQVSSKSQSVLKKQFAPLKLTIPNRDPVKVSSLTERKGIPLRPVDLVSTIDNSSAQNTFGSVKVENSHWTANWRKQQNKKHRTWDGDAYVSHIGDKLTMITEDGKIIGVTAWKGQPLYSGFNTYIGGKEVELDSEITASQLPVILGGSLYDSALADPGARNPPLDTHLDLVQATNSLGPHTPSPVKNHITPVSFYGVMAKSKPKAPLHDPTLPDAVVMKAPTKECIKKYNKKDLPIVPVVLDPILARHMRPHQKEGVKFLYECVMGLRKHEGQGCILADEMGLGKTLQTISLVWTLLKQNPFAGGGPVLSKVLVVCPVSLVNNWKMEFHKWLGKDRVGVVVWGDKNAISIFTVSKNHHVLVIGYERLKTVIGQLTSCVPPIDLIICDEGHRLKSANNKTASMFKALRTPRRVILSGTPIQNDLSEFHAMADFCNPGLLDDYTTFRRVYEIPILKSRAPNCSEKELEVGAARSAQLLTVGRSFVLRRDATLLKNFLPPKHEYVVFITPTPLQLSIFSKILNPDKLDNLMQSLTAETLALINILTKISNSPILLKATADKAKAKASSNESIQRAGVQEALSLLPERARIEDMSLSGKLFALSKFLSVIRQNTEEKCILVSHYTSTLNILEAFCKKSNYSYYRLDGQTPAAKRQEFVNAFNKSSQRSSFIFLLSSKAGGVGINLIGASRLCLIDSDWNPSHDLQSMARIHRDGQKRPVFIYRFLTAGTIDEKIYQRQVTKLGLSNSLIGSETSGSKSDSFSRKDLRDIFRIHTDTPCNTHDLLECPCSTMPDAITKIDSASDDCVDEDAASDSEKGFVAASQVKPAKLKKMDKAYLQKKKAELAALGEWKHINCLRYAAKDDIQDDILRKLIYTPKLEVEFEPQAQPKSRLDSLPLAVDIDNLATMGEQDLPLGVRDVPGGTISFLFEKVSTTALEDEAII